MNPATYVPIIVMWIVIFMLISNRRKNAIVRKVINKRKTEGNREMKELAKRFIGKECLISSFEGHQYEGVIKEVTDGAILVDKNGNTEAINLDFIIRIREFPKNKKGKKKSVVLS